jgi:hypothetical protein
MIFYSNFGDAMFSKFEIGKEIEFDPFIRDLVATLALGL